MNLGPDTKLFVSVSSRPGRFGATVYNSLFERLGIAAVYLPRPAPARAREIIESIRALSVSGCSVSSPHKAGVCEYLDSLEAEAEECGAVNTVFRCPDGTLRGACSDIDGVVGSLRAPVEARKIRSALIFGSGGVVGPAVVALRRLGVDRVSVFGRRSDRVRSVAKRFDVGVASRADAAALVINATPAGSDTCDVDGLSGFLERSEVFLDMPVRPGRTAIAQSAAERNQTVIDGSEMCIYQIASQAQRYLGRPVCVNTVREIVRDRYLAVGSGA